MSNRTPSDQRGFTLLEVLVATVIAAIALAVLFEGVSSGLRATHAALRREEALVRARSHLAALQAATTLTPGHREGDDGGGYRWHLTVRPIASAAATSAGPAAAVSHPLSLYEISVRIDWTGSGADGGVTLESRAIGPSPAGDTP